MSLTERIHRCAVLAAYVAVAGCAARSTELPRAPSLGTIGLYASVVREESLLRDLGVDGPRRIVVTRVVPGGPADKANIAPRDVLHAIQGHRVDTAGAAIDAIRRSAPGTQIELIIVRNGEERIIAVEVEELLPPKTQHDPTDRTDRTDPTDRSSPEDPNTSHLGDNPQCQTQEPAHRPSR